MNHCEKRAECANPCGRATNSAGYEIQAHAGKDGWLAISESGATRCEAEAVLELLTPADPALKDKPALRVYEALSA